MWAIMNALHDRFGNKLKDTKKNGYVNEGNVDCLSIAGYYLASNENGLITELTYMGTKSCTGISSAQLST